MLLRRSSTLTERPIPITPLESDGSTPATTGTDENSADDRRGRLEVG